MELLSRTCKTETMNIERIIARAFVILGGLFWILMFFGSQTQARYAHMVYTVADVEKGLLNGLIPLVITVVVFVLGMFYERLTALLLVIGAAGVVVWGVIDQWGVGVWMTIAALLIAPMLIAALLYWLAGRMQQICLLEQHG